MSTYTLKIYRSDTGSVYEIPVNSPSILIETIKESIQSITNLSPSEQILLADTNLFSNRTLESYGITKDKEIYLFNKRIIDNPNLKPDEIEIPLDDLFNQPKIPVYKNIRELENSNNPINKLNALDMHLRNQFLQIQYIKETFDNKLVQCQNLLYEIIVQKKSISFALNNFKEYRENFINVHNNFLQNFKRVSNNCESLLLTFESDMSKLKQIKLHDSHRTPLRNTLGDCIPEQEVRRWYEQSKRDYDTMKTKITEVDFQITAVNDSVDYELKKLPNLSNDNDVSERIKIIIEHCKQLQSFLLAFSSNSEKIKRFLDQINRSGTMDPNQISNFILSFQEIKTQQDFTLQSGNTLNNDVMKSITIINKAKNFMSHYSFDGLRNISRLQDKIRTIKSSYPIWNEALSKLSTTFLQLEIIHRFPTAYEESINETIRRKKFGNSLINSFSRYIDSLNNIKDEENQKRTKYLEQFFNYIPNNISFFQSLKELLPKFIINLPEFDILLNNNSNNNINNSFNNSQGFSYSGNNSQGSFQDEDEEFTVIEGINNDYFNQNSNSTTTTQGAGGTNSISPNVSKKYQMELEKSLSEFKIQESQKIKMLESKLQSTFLLASKSDEKYKDLLEKSKLNSQNNQMDKSTILDSQLKIEELKSQLEEKKLEISKIQSEIIRITEESNQQVKKIELLNTNQVIYDDKIQKYKETIDKLQLSNESYEKEIKELEEKLNEESKKVNQGQFQLEDLEKQIKDIKDERASSLKLKDLEIEKLTSELDYLHQSSSTNKKDKDSFIETLSNQITQLNGLLEEKDTLISSLNRDCSSLKEEISKLDTNLLSVKTSESKNSDIVKELSNQIQSMELQLSEYRTQNQFLTESNRSKDKNIHSVNDQLNQCQEAIVEFNNRIQALHEQTESVIQLKDTITNLKLQHQQSIAAIISRDKMIKELETENNTLIQTISKQTQQINELDTSLLQQKEHMDEKNHSMHSNDKVIVSQQEEIQKLRQKERDMEARIQTLENQAQDNSRDKLYIQQLESDSEQKAHCIKDLYDQIAMMEELKDYQHLVQQISTIIQPKSQGILDRVTILKAVSEINLQKETSFSLEQTIQKQNKEMELLKYKIEELENANIAYQIHKEQNPHHLPQIKHDNTALLSDFSHSRNAIFVPNQNGYYEALNVNSPRYFLSTDSQGSFDREFKTKRPIIGTIIEIETKTSGQDDSYRLPPGTEFHEVLLGRID